MTRIFKFAMPQSASKTIACLLASSFFSLGTLAADLYVSPQGSDSNSGSQAAPFRTIQKASSAVSPGTTVHVAPGTYAETIQSSVNGSSSARIRFVSDTKWGAKLVPAAGAYSMWSVTGGYTDIDGFQVDGSGSTTVRIGISLTGGNSSVRNSWVHHLAEKSGCDNQGGAGLLANQARGLAYINYDFENNLVHDVGGGCGWIQGIYHQSTGNIKNNLVYACSQAVDMGHDGHNINVVNNTFFGNAGYAIYFGGCKEAYNNGCPTSGIKIHNNIIFDNYGGVQGPIASEDVGNEVKNNLIYGNNIDLDLASPSKNSRTGEINADPQFVNYMAKGGGNYQLKSTSPAINRGLATLAPSVDYAGSPRLDGAVDIGAYEYGASITPAPAGSAEVSFSPGSLTFPNQLLGTVSSVLFITMKNTGSATLDASKTWSLSGDFAFGNIGTCGNTLAPGATCTISLQFSPTVAGLRSGKFTMVDNTAAGSHSVTLTGTGLPLAKPVLSLSTSSLSFAFQKVGTRSSAQKMTLKNSGSAALSFPSRFAISGDFAFGSTCQANVAYAPGSSCTVTVTFKPRTKGTRTGTLSIQSNASATPMIIKLSGTGF